MKEKTKKRSPGRPRVHEVGKWSCVQFRMPSHLRTLLFEVLKQRNDKLSYRLSLNSLLLELIDVALQKGAITKTEEHGQENAEK